MPRKPGRKQISTTVTAEQHAAATVLAGKEGLNAYVRRLIAEDAEKRGVEWPDNLPERGKYDRSKTG